MTDCIFCKIRDKEIPSDFVHEDDLVYVINDINPKASTHYLIIPKEHIAKVSDFNESHSDLVSHIMLKAVDLGKDLEGYKLQFNVGEKGGQEVMHVHLHLMGL